MKKTKVELFWEHPTRYILLMFLAVATLCILLTYMPKWFNGVCTIVLVVVVVKKIIKWEKEQKNRQRNQEEA